MQTMPLTRFSGKKSKDDSLANFYVQQRRCSPNKVRRERLRERERERERGGGLGRGRERGRQTDKQTHRGRYN